MQARPRVQESSVDPEGIRRGGEPERVDRYRAPARGWPSSRVVTTPVSTMSAAAADNGSAVTNKASRRDFLLPQEPADRRLSC